MQCAGIGPGLTQPTRVIAGVGVPQLSAIYDVAKALSNVEAPVIADGGIRYSGDIAGALAAGANTIMAGSLLRRSGRKSPGETIIFNGRNSNHIVEWFIEALAYHGTVISRMSKTRTSVRPKTSNASSYYVDGRMMFQRSRILSIINL